MTRNCHYEQEISACIHFCTLIKQIYFENVEWSECHKEVAIKFSLFKKILKKFYATDDILEVLKKAQGFKIDDVKEFFDMNKDNSEEKVQKTSPKYGDNVIWFPVPVDNPGLIKKVREIIVS